MCAPHEILFVCLFLLYIYIYFLGSGYPSKFRVNQLNKYVNIDVDFS